MLITKKKCNACGCVKDIGEFPKAHTCADGHRNKCKECTYEMQKKWKSVNKDKYLESQRRYNKAKSNDVEFKAMKSVRGVIYRRANPQKIKMKSYITFDKKRSLLNDLDIEYCINEMNKPCVYCGFIDPLCNGLDRIDNSKGHTKDNCVTCCSLCNTTRMNNYTHDEFMKYIAPGIVALRRYRGEI